MPSTSLHCSASQASVPYSCSAGPPVSRPSRGHGQGVPVDLARGPGRQVGDRREQRDQGGGQFGAQLLDGRRVVPAVLGDDIADEELVAAAGGPYGGRGARDPGQRLERGVHLAQLDPPAAELDLLVGPPEEDQPLRFGLDQVTAAVGALPAEGLQRGVLLRVLLGVEIAGQARPRRSPAGRCRPSAPARRPRRRRPAPSRSAAARSGSAPRRSSGRRRRRRWPRWARTCSRPRGPRSTSRCTSSGGQASPPKISSRTSLRASGSHSAASVGTVETTVISCSTSQGPRSAPLRTWERGTGTRQAP